jgi:acyl-CoA synthetase (AMP-forming)/AMP-acid ligase II
MSDVAIPIVPMFHVKACGVPYSTIGRVKPGLRKPDLESEMHVRKKRGLAVFGTRLRIVDRTKDVIESGGECISSIELENIAVAYPDVAAAAVIAVPHHKWQERPLLVIVKNDGSSVDL